MIILNWSDFKTIVDNKELKIQYNETNDKYFLFAMDVLEYQCILIKNADTKTIIGIDSSTEVSNVTDFETNYKPTANDKLVNRDDRGNSIMTPTLDDSQGLMPKKQSYQFNANLGEINFFDIEITTEKRLSGGEYWVKINDNPEYVTENDILEFSVVDKNDILGLFSTYGLTVGEDVLELKKFVINDYPKVGLMSNGKYYYKQCYETVKGTSLVSAGLFLRIKYDSKYEPQSGDDTTIQVTPRIFYYE